MRGATKLLFPLFAVSLAGCVSTPKYTNEQINELHAQFAKCMPNTVRHHPDGGVAMLTVNIAEGGKITDARVKYRSERNDQRFGNRIISALRGCQNLDTDITGKVSIPFKVWKTPPPSTSAPR